MKKLSLSKEQLEVIGWASKNIRKESSHKFFRFIKKHPKFAAFRLTNNKIVYLEDMIRRAGFDIEVANKLIIEDGGFDNLELFIIKNNDKPRESLKASEQHGIAKPKADKLIPRDGVPKSELTVEKAKICPYCAEKIQAEAILCRYCKSSLTEPIESPKPEKSAKNTLKEVNVTVSDGIRGGCGLVLVLLFLLLVFAIYSA